MNARNPVPAETPGALLQSAWEMRHEDTRGALALNTQALHLAWQAGDVRAVSCALLRVGLCHLILGDDDDLAMQQLQQAAALLQGQHDSAGEAEAHNLLASLHSRRGDFAQAAVLQGRCLALHRRAGNRLGEANTLNNLALLLRDTQRFADALELAFASLEIGREIGDARAQAYALSNIGHVLAATGDAAAAIDHFERSLSLAANTRDLAFECTVRIALGQALTALQRDETALAQLRHALVLARRTGNRADLADALAALGRAELARRGLDAARGLLDDALQTAAPLRDPVVTSRVLCAIGEHRLLAGDHAEAVSRLEAALAAALAAGSDEAAAPVYRLLADLYESLGDSTAALQHLRRCQACEQRLHGHQARQRMHAVLVHARLQPLRREVEAQRRRVRELAGQLDAARRGVLPGP